MSKGSKFEVRSSKFEIRLLSCAGPLLGSFLFMGVWLISCSPGDPKFQQYFVEGEQLYLKNCSNCHQKDGTGLGRVYPPLANSDFMEKHFDEIPCLMKKGRRGAMTVNGDVYVQAMPGIVSLTELEIAEISTYIYNSWGHKRGFIDAKQVNKSLQPCLKE
jgi:cytochrome c551